MPEVANSGPHPGGNPPNCSRDSLRGSSGGGCPGNLERSLPMNFVGCLRRNPARSGERNVVLSPDRSSGLSGAGRSCRCLPVRGGRCPDGCCPVYVHSCLVSCFRVSFVESSVVAGKWGKKGHSRSARYGPRLRGLGPRPRMSNIRIMSPPAGGPDTSTERRDGQMPLGGTAPLSAVMSRAAKEPRGAVAARFDNALSSHHNGERKSLNAC
jgi:hypothetical protein